MMSKKYNSPKNTVMLYKTKRKAGAELPFGINEILAPSGSSNTRSIIMVLSIPMWSLNSPKAK